MRRSKDLLTRGLEFKIESQGEVLTVGSPKGRSNGQIIKREDLDVRDFKGEDPNG